MYIVFIKFIDSRDCRGVCIRWVFIGKELKFIIYIFRNDVNSIIFVFLGELLMLLKGSVVCEVVFIGIFLF